jgi:hypothetical protein
MIDDYHLRKELNSTMLQQGLRPGTAEVISLIYGKYYHWKRENQPEAAIY